MNLRVPGIEPEIFESQAFVLTNCSPSKWVRNSADEVVIGLKSGGVAAVPSSHG